ncbi:RadC family protein [Marinicella rhabdoformis]|uniref:RadC family protein n=1 Tax=Marinicella rhabdoformis TaxID=2580566 RepID=UPI001FEAFCF1|nr:DNA repair protein RadC [Marinicella rhabdoformis]
MPREKLLKYGAATLSDAELLAIFLRTGTKEMPVLILANHLISYFGSLHAIIKASPKQFINIKGLGPAKYVQIQAVNELATRSLKTEVSEKPSFTDPDLVRRYLLNHFEQTAFERFACLFLNSKNRLITFEYLFTGSISQAQVYPRTVAQQCLKFNAASVIFAHNHPSGDVSPSESDKQLTQRLIETLRLIDVKVLDHFVIGSDKCFSMAEHQML